MNYETIQNDIAARLETANTPTAVWEVEVLPEKEEDYKRPVLKGFGRITVEYHSSTYAKPMSTDSSNQEEIANFIVHIRASALYGNKGIHALLELVKAKLVGFKPTNCKKLRLVRCEPQPKTDNIWLTILQFETTCVQVELDDPSTDVLITQITVLPPVPTIIQTITTN